MLCLPGRIDRHLRRRLRRLSDRATYLYVDGTRYWYDTQPSVTRIARDRAAGYAERAADEIAVELLHQLRDDCTGHGQRGEFAAVQVAPSSSGEVPCIVRADLGGDADAVLTMLVENTRRRDLSVIEEAGGYAQLQTGWAVGDEDGQGQRGQGGPCSQGIDGGGSEVATAVAGRDNLTLAQALVLAEFEDDAEAAETLAATATSDPGRWDHVVGRLRSDRLAEAALQAAVAQLEEAGIRVVDEGDLPEGC